jgi:signal transduction histidine kinase
MPRIGLVKAVSRQSLLIALVCVVLDMMSLYHGGGPVGWVAVLHVATIVVLDLAVALPVRTSGWLALARAAAEIVTALFHGHTPMPVETGEHGSLVIAYRAGAWLGRPWAFWSLAALAAAPIAVHLATGRENWVATLARVAGNAALPWMVGRFNTSYRKRLDEMLHRRDTERRDAEAAVEKAVAKERVVIARDLHDVISHHVSAIGVHAGAARMAMAGRETPGPVGDSLAAVETASRATMADLRTMLDLLYGTADDAAQPGLDNLDELVRRSGPGVRLTVHGPPRALPASSDVALYRIAQELLANALRHGDDGPVDLRLRYDEDTVTLTARNGVGVPGAPAGTGRGLDGIRTRAGLFHGTVTHGPDEDGRHWVTSVAVPATEAA